MSDIILGYVNKSNTWDIDIGGDHSKKIIESMISDNFSEESAEHILHCNAPILSMCPNPEDDKPIHTKGLIYGKIQSGKTANFLALIALAFDNKYKIAVLLGGNTTELADQNAERAKSYFSNMKDVEVIYVAKNNNVSADTILSLYKSDKKILIVTIKTSAGINKVQTRVGNDIFPETPILIIDDEGDCATPNTKVSKNEFSSTYRAAMDFARSSTMTCFLSVTATPQANILISILDELSPDFVRLVYPGKGYCGLSKFHDPNNTNYRKLIPSNDLDMLINENGMPQSLLDALSDYFVGGAIRKYRGDERKHSMLIHPSGITDDHELVKNKIKMLLTKWNNDARTYVNTGGEEHSFNYEKLNNLLKKSYRNMKTTCENLPDYEKLEPLIMEIIYCSKITPIVINGNNLEDRKLITDYNIVIGGNLLQRGITIPGLAISYMPRRPNKKANADTVEQRARWLGYRDYIDVCRVYLTESSINDYENLLQHDNELWSWAEKSVKYNDLKTIPRIMKLEGELIPTRTSVAKSYKLKLQNWYVSSHLNIHNKDVVHNLDVVKIFRDNYCNNGKKYNIGNGNTESRHYYKENIKWNTVKDNLLYKINYNELSSLTKETVAKLNEVFEEINEKPLVDVLWMRENYQSERTIEQNGRFGALQTGRSNSLDGYVGDKYIEINEKNVQVQLYYIHNQNHNDKNKYVAVAIKIPTYIQNKLVGLITNDEGM